MTLLKNLFQPKPPMTMEQEVAEALTAGDHARLAVVFGLSEAREAWWAGLCYTKAGASDDAPQARREARDWLVRRGLPLPTGCIEG
jgi:hypothetical protein